MLTTLVPMKLMIFKAIDLLMYAAPMNFKSMRLRVTERRLIMALTALTFTKYYCLMEIVYRRQQR